MTTPTLPTVSEALDRAADLITEHGFAKHEFRSPEGGYCAVGAVQVVMFGDVLSALPPTADHNMTPAWDVYDAAIRHAEHQLGGVPLSLFNDAHTAEQVVGFLHTCAQIAEVGK